MPAEFKDRRAEPRTIVDSQYNVEFQFTTTPFEYRLKVWDISFHGMGVLVKEGSEILKHLQPGTPFNVKLYEPGSPVPRESRGAQVKHITRAPEERAKGHFIVGFAFQD